MYIIRVFTERIPWDSVNSANREKIQKQESIPVWYVRPACLPDLVEMPPPAQMEPARAIWDPSDPDGVPVDPDEAARPR